MHIYIYIEREREREKHREMQIYITLYNADNITSRYACIQIYAYTHISINIKIHTIYRNMKN